MRAAWYERTGPAAEVFTVGEMEAPWPGPGEVRVRLHTSGVNPSDVKRRAAFRGGGIEFPRIVPHSDGAGVIDAVGPGVTAARVGERVWTWNARWQRPFGTAATYITLPADQAVRLADGVDFAAGACLGIPGMTAHRCVFADGPVSGQTVLVTGGAGAVGHYAVQLAKWGGATVIATVSSDAKAAMAREAGADDTVNYRSENVVERVRDLTKGAGVDRIVDVAFGANLATSMAALKSSGVIAAYGSDAEPEPCVPFYPMIQRDATVRFVLVYIMPDAAKRSAITDLTAACEAGALRRNVALRLPLAEIATAHVAVERGTAIGNVVVDIS